MRRVALVFAAAFVCAAPAQAASLSVAPREFSPRHATLQVSATLGLPRQVGVSLVTRGGRRLGWIVPPARRTTLAVGWDGRIEGKRVPDGLYVVKLVFQSAVLATTTLHIDTQAPQLVLRATNGATRFGGDNQLLTTISPNGDGFRDRANVTFRLREPATVTMDVTRTVKVPHSIYTLTSHLAPGVQTLTWAPPTTTNPRTFLVRITAVDRAGNRVVYGAANAFVGRAPRGVVVRVQGIDAGFGQPSYAPGQVARLHLATDAPALTMRVFRSGPEQVVTYADNQMAGVDTGVFTDANARSLEMTGLTLEEMRQTHFGQVIHPEDLHLIQDGFDRAMAGDPQVVEARVVRTTARSSTSAARPSRSSSPTRSSACTASPRTSPRPSGSCASSRRPTPPRRSSWPPSATRSVRRSPRWWARPSC